MNASKFPGTKLRPFSLSDMGPIPEGWRCAGPDFVGVGTIKAGTTWWYSLLLEHPQIVPNRLKQKELRYFVHFGYKGLHENDIDTYKQAFAAPAGKLCGEWSPIYLSHPFCTKYIAEASPGAKILVILRNPIDQVLSFLNEAKYGSSIYHFGSDQQHVFDCFDLYPRAMKSGSYADDLHRLLCYFDRQQILVLQYEKCRNAPLGEIERTYRFLGVDTACRPRNIERAVNKKNYLVQRLDAGERQRLRDYFMEDVCLAVEMFPDIDISLWEEFNS